MEPSELLGRVVEVLESLGIRYLVTGSTATIFYGEPRFTADIDIVTELPASLVAGLVDAFDRREFYLDEESARRAVARHGQFNLIHPASGLKVDFIVSGGEPFDQSRFGRARRVQVAAARQVSFASPEDVILMKLVYYREGGSEKHLRDIAGVIRISGDELEWLYLDRWAAPLGVAEIWSRVKTRLGA